MSLISEHAELVIAFGKVAGIGGLAMIVFVYLFREVIQRTVFPKLRPEQAYRIIMLFLVLVFLFSCAGLFAYAYIETPDKIVLDKKEMIVLPPEDPAPILDSALALIDAQNYEEFWLGSYFKKTMSKNDYVTLMKTTREQIGFPIKRIITNTGSALSPPGLPAGHYYYKTYKSEFSTGNFYLETVTLIGATSGWEVYSHNIVPLPQGM